MNSGKRLSLVLLVLSPCMCFAESIWLEGEAATSKQVSRHGWYDSVKKDVLSGSDWLSHFNENQPGLATFVFECVEGGEYTFWIRANPVKSSLSYRLNDGASESIDLSANQRGAMNIASDNKPDLRFISWSKVGKIALQKGRNQLEFRMDSAAQNHGGIDCMCLTNEPWVPSGTDKPSDKSAAAAPDEWFPVVMDDDPFSPDSVIDMSQLVEAPAGQNGFLLADGDALRFRGESQPVKFWGVNASVGERNEVEMIQAARWFRKHGINIVRQHTVLNAVGLMDANGNFDAERMDRYDRWFATLKEQGIYTTWSIIYPHHGPFLQKHDGYDPDLYKELDAGDKNHDGTQEAIVVNDFINLDPRLQEIAFRYFERLLDHTNPYTGLKYKDDPALVILEFQNESNVFFHTLNGLRNGEYPRFARGMRRLFFRFVQSKYGDRDAVAQAWGGRWDRDDNWEDGELGLMGAFHWGADGPLYEFKGQTRRTGDYIEFLARLQRDYYARRQAAVRDAGFQGVTVTTAWRAGGPAASMANLYADTAADMIDRHDYFGGGDGGHRIVEGKVSIATHLDQPGRGLMALGLFQVEQRPFGVSEWSMMPPAPYKAEAAPLYAFYGMGLQGWDASYHFACGTNRMGDGWHELGKYVTQTPHYIGQFPALAFAVYHNHIQQGEVVAARRLSREEVFSGRDALGQSLAGGGHDDKQLTGRLLTPPEAIAIGRVTVAFGNGESKLRDLSPYWNRESKSLTSTTGQLVWRYGEKRVEVRSPKTQAVIGFAEGKVQLPAAEVDVRTPFVSLILTPLDDLPLAESRNVLITALARDKQTGTVYNEDWSKLVQIGGPPLLLEPVQATIKLAGNAPSEVLALDPYGVPKQDKLEIQADGSFQIDGTHRAYYYQLKR